MNQPNADFLFTYSSGSHNSELYDFLSHKTILMFSISFSFRR
jgi:hypothetical protein